MFHFQTDSVLGPIAIIFLALPIDVMTDVLHQNAVLVRSRFDVGFVDRHKEQHTSHLRMRHPTFDISKTNEKVRSADSKEAEIEKIGKR